MSELIEKDLTDKILNCAYKVHSNLGSGLLEKTYEECFAYELQKIGLFVEKQKELPLIYNEVKLEVGYRIDLLIENRVIIEIKSVEALNEVHTAQLLTLGVELFFNKFQCEIIERWYKKICKLEFTVVLSVFYSVLLRV